MPDLTFRSRVDAFWSWFGEREQSLYDALQQGTLDPDELTEAIERVAPTLAWELCPSPEEGREGIALSGEGVVGRCMLAKSMAERAPALERFTVFSSKQPSPDIAGATVRLGDGDELAFADFRFGIDFDTDDNLLTLRVHHPAFAQLPPGTRDQLAFIALDNALGEELISAYVGPVDIDDEPEPGHKYGIDELRRQARAALSLHGIDPDQPPAQMWSTYSMEDPDGLADGDVVARGDVFTGSTCDMGLVHSFSDPDAEDDLEGSGACHAYVMVPVGDLRDGEELDHRCELQDALDATLHAVGAGALVGGAMGSQYAYVDLILYDEPDALARIPGVLEAAGLPRATLRYFAPARRDEAVAIPPA